MKTLKLKKLINLLLLVFIVSTYSCNKFNNNDDDNDNTLLMEKLVIADNFNYETSKDVSIQIYAKNNQDNPIPNVKFNLYTADPEEGGLFILSGVTNENGQYFINYEIPTYYNELVVTTNYIGLQNMAIIPVTDEGIIHTFGGSQNKSLKSNDIVENINFDFAYLGTYNSSGVPNYLEPVNDIIDSDFLDDINNTLPEQIQLPVGHPQYFEDGLQHNISLLDPADVYVTFVHEGAGYKNVLGFYTFETGNPPSSIDDIETITIIYPNVSYQGSGGGLVSGNKVNIGQFPGNTTIGWVLFANGWYNGQVNNSYYKFFSDPNLNPESTATLRQHTVLLNDLGRNLILLGIEDLKREGGWCDHDFNDAVFYITADPLQSVDLSNLPMIDYTGVDSDSDGITDENDDYPDNPNMAFNNYFFTQGTYGTIAFEDMWPGTGDYDFNDLVIDYNFNQITNADNKVVEIYGEFVLKAFGASFHNGFGIDLGINPNMITSVTGYNTQESWVDLNAKGLENGQTNAVFIVFDDTYNLMSHVGGIGVNVNPTYDFVTPDTTNIHIILSEPADLADIGIPPYNPFLIVNQDRTVEIHLPDHTPTDLADASKFGTFRDDSDPANGRYYKTINNLPWAIKVIEEFKYPIEKTEILNTHLKFGVWAESSGQTYTDWYKDLSGYRNAGNIYTEPSK
ncbi:MAG: LruC domain-containing protein [Bacteroidales bacterium]|nr:LruC domain-containing protein [Bacteroidales bacterium]